MRYTGDCVRCGEFAFASHKKTTYSSKECRTLSDALSLSALLGKNLRYLRCLRNAVAKLLLALLALHVACAALLAKYLWSIVLGMRFAFSLRNASTMRNCGARMLRRASLLNAVTSRNSWLKIRQSWQESWLYLYSGRHRFLKLLGWRFLWRGIYREEPITVHWVDPTTRSTVQNSVRTVVPRSHNWPSRGILVISIPRGWEHS